MALAVISTVAYFTQFPLLFPPLGPSAFILFRMPMSAAAAPRTVLLSHIIGLGSGFLALFLGHLLFSYIPSESSPVTHASIAVLSMSMGLSSLAMIWLETNHPPATATALIVGMGSITTLTQTIGFIIAVLLLINIAFLFNRILGGLPYSYWRHNPNVASRYGTLAGITNHRQDYWQQLASKMSYPDLKYNTTPGQEEADS